MENNTDVVDITIICRAVEQLIFNRFYRAFIAVERTFLFAARLPASEARGLADLVHEEAHLAVQNSR